MQSLHINCIQLRDIGRRGHHNHLHWSFSWLERFLFFSSTITVVHWSDLNPKTLQLDNNSKWHLNFIIILSHRFSREYLSASFTRRLVHCPHTRYARKTAPANCCKSIKSLGQETSPVIFRKIPTCRCQRANTKHMLICTRISFSTSSTVCLTALNPSVCRLVQHSLIVGGGDNILWVHFFHYLLYTML